MERAPSNPHRLLVVDDNEDNLEMLARRLERRGYEVGRAASGREAIEAIERGGYEAVILDVNMPGMNGFEVLQTVRESRTKLELPILMATARNDSSDIVNALRLGANDYVTKPVDIAEVAARLETQLALRREFFTSRSEAARITSPDTMAPGTVLDGRYEISGTIGQGGFAVVYRGRQLSTGQDVAIKVLRAHRALRADYSHIEATRFRREMQVIGSVRHPAIVRLIDSGSFELDGFETLAPPTAQATSTGTLVDSMSWVPNPRREAPSPARADASEVTEGEQAPSLAARAEVPYFVMEFLEGETLAELLTRVGRLPAVDALELFFPVIAGVDALHRRDIIHRDLKPANVFLHEVDGAELQPKVLDFGIAKLQSEEVDDHATIGFVGTPSYMAPEQALGARDLDARCDQYALAVMLYEALAGARPFVADNYTQILLLVTTADAEPLARVCNIDAKLSDVVARAMCKQPEQRYPDLSSFAQALLESAPDLIRSRWVGSFV